METVESRLFNSGDKLPEADVINTILALGNRVVFEIRGVRAFSVPGRNVVVQERVVISSRRQYSQQERDLNERLSANTTILMYVEGKSPRT